MRNGDRAESRLPSAAVTRGRKRKSDVEWIRCCHPGCGKWRAVLRGADSSAIIKKLNNNRWNTKTYNWYCSMNSWDDTNASCSAPQEPMYDCPWNLEGPVEDV